MDIYLDFEATQFTENIIAIGASCEYGKFDCLVKPPRKKELTKFITSLTGITPEMIEYALTPDEAFYDLFFLDKRNGARSSWRTYFLSRIWWHG